MSNTFKITEDLFWVGALDPNLKIFDIIMETKFGTSYNSYLLRGSEGIALFETVKEKFFDEHLEKIRSVINLEDINTNSKKGGVDIVASVGQAGEIGVTGTIADKLDKKVVTSSAIVVENLSNNGNITIDREKRENKDIERDEKNIEKIIENSSSKGGTFLIIGPVKAGANATKSHRTGSYDVN